MLRTIVIVLFVILVFNTLFWVAMVLYHVHQDASRPDFQEWVKRQEAPFPLKGNVVQDLAWLVSINALAIAGLYFLLSDRLKKLRQIIGVGDTELDTRRDSPP